VEHNAARDDAKAHPDGFPDEWVLAAEALGQLQLVAAQVHHPDGLDAWDAARLAVTEDVCRAHHPLGADAGKLAVPELVYLEPGDSTLGESVVRVAVVAALAAVELALDKPDAGQSAERSSADRAVADERRSELPDAAVAELGPQAG
jgi:hypothetical protein